MVWGTPPKKVFEDADSKNEKKFAKFEMAHQKWWTGFSKKLSISEKTWRNSRIGIFEDGDSKNKVIFAKFKISDRKWQTGFPKKMVVSEQT